MKNYGLTEVGFNRKPFDVIKEEIENSLTSSLGKLNFTPPSVFAQITSVFAEREAVLWELSEAVYNSQYPSTAEGFSLDGVCAMTGLIRLQATYSEVLAQLTASNYTTIPIYSEALVDNTNVIFSLDEEIVVTNEKCIAITLEIINSTLTNYTIIIDNIEYSYDYEENDLNPDIGVNIIAQGLVEKLQLNEAFEISRVDGFVSIKSKDHLKLFACKIKNVSSGNPEINIIDCTVNATFFSKQKGAFIVPTHTLRTIQTPISGWISIDNINAGISGRNLETDVALRRRRSESFRLSGSGTIEALKARILNITGVSSVSVIENATDETDSENRPPHSFETLVLGGEDVDIANMIWLAKPAGIQTVGNTTKLIKDSGSNDQIVKFSRPTKTYVYVDVALTKTLLFLEDSIVKIKNDIATKINSLGVGQPVVFQSLFAAIYSVNGISSAVITIGNTAVEQTKPAMNSQNVSIASFEIAITDISKISIT